MVTTNFIRKHSLTLRGKEIEQVKPYMYLGNVTSENGRMNAELDEKLGNVGKLFNALKIHYWGIKRRRKI